MSPPRIGEWQVGERLAGDGEVRRYRLVHLGTGEPAEGLVLAHPQAPGSGWFLRLHRELAKLEDPSLVRTLAIERDGDTTWVVRQPLETPTLADLRGPLAPSVVAALGARLVPSVLTAGPATRGALTPSDLGIDEHGAPIVAPRGKPEASHNADDRAYVAPEAWHGAADGRAGLYGLGVLLHELLTGKRPSPAESPAPPSAHQTGVPQALDRAIAALLSSRPADRNGALRDLRAVAGDLPDLRLLVADSARARFEAGHVRTTRGRDSASRGRRDAPQSATRDEPTPYAMVLVGAAEVRALDGDGRSALAGHSGLTVGELNEQATANLPIVLSAHNKARQAYRAVQGHELETLGAAAVASPGWLRPLGALSALGLALIALAPTAVVSAWFGLAAALPALLSVALFARWRADRVQFGAAQSAWRLQEPSRRRLEREGPLARLWRQLSDARVALASSSIPEAALLDLRAGLRDTERRLNELTQSLNRVESGLTGSDAASLRIRAERAARRAGNDPSQGAERDALVRTLTDVETLQARRLELHAELEPLADALAAVAALAAHTDADSAARTEQVSRQLQRTARLALGAVDSGP